MTDKELIKQEIERLKEHTAKCGYPGQGEFENGNREGRNWACDKLLSFINSLPEESGCEVNFTTKSEDLEEEMIRWHKEHFDNKRDWEKTSGEYLTRKSQLDIASHFAEWQKHQMKEALQTEYEKGRFDMREEMMNDAVEGVVHHFPHDELAAVHYNDPKGTPMSIYVSSKGLSAGDKVKILIVKIEQQ